MIIVPNTINRGSINTSNPPSVPPQGISTSNPSATNALTFKQKLEARKQHANLDKELMKAVIRNNASLADSLLQQGANVNAFGLANVVGGGLLVPPIYVAAHQKHNDVLRVLLKYNPEIDAVSENHKDAALNAAIWAKNEEGCEELLAAGADPNRLRSVSGTPLQQAAMNNDKGMVELLLLAGANVNLQSNNPMGKTALAVACRVANWSCARLLVENGADMEELDDGPYTYLKKYMTG